MWAGSESQIFSQLEYSTMQGSTWYFIYMEEHNPWNRFAKGGV
jgi:hypothetical protein